MTGLTGKTRYRIHGRGKRSVVVLQAQVEGVMKCSPPKPVKVEPRWVDAEPEWLMNGDLKR